MCSIMLTYHSKLMASANCWCRCFSIIWYKGTEETGFSISMKMYFVPFHMEARNPRLICVITGLLMNP